MIRKRKTSREKIIIEPKEWKKVLYKDQGVPDNYVNSNFLSEMTKNKYVERYEYSQLVFLSVVLTQQLCIVFIFILCWWFMGDGSIPPQYILAIFFFLSTLGYVAYLKINPCSAIQQKVFSDLKTAILLLSFTAFFSPVLQTLTHTISTDTVYTMTTVMLMGHLIFHDYDSRGIFSSRSISLNMSVFAAVCLASRLETILHTFVSVFLALLLFGLWPLLRRSLWLHKPKYLQRITIFMCVVVLIGLAIINLFSSLAFLTVIISITFIFPALMVSLQSQKNNIHGPWDEAVIQEK